ncbi:unnamed protein product, partial [Meganyctiphanes norvegica]
DTLEQYTGDTALAAEGDIPSIKMWCFSIALKMLFIIALLTSQVKGNEKLDDLDSSAKLNTKTLILKEDPKEQRISLNAKAAYCYPTLLCTQAGGHCVTSGKDCNGTIDPYGCRGGKKCKCCIPEVSGCGESFTPVGDSCLLLALSKKVTWAAARQYCQGLGADLVVFKDANHYAKTLDYVRRVNGENTAVNVWIGGSDAAVEGRWVWVTEELMPRGPPFWGSHDGYGSEPGGGTGQNCAGLYHPDRYYVHDFPCTTALATLCQKI